VGDKIRQQRGGCQNGRNTPNVFRPPLHSLYLSPAPLFYCQTRGGEPDHLLLSYHSWTTGTTTTATHCSVPILAAMEASTLVFPGALREFRSDRSAIRGQLRDT
jgi:hypothetical protein